MPNSEPVVSLVSTPQYTPTQVRLALAASGRNVTQRRLKDWRDARYLPALRRRGLGQRRGTIQVWIDPSVVETAALIHDMLAAHGQTNVLHANLWLLGRDISVDDFRRSWVNGLADTHLSVERTVSNDADPEDGLANFAASKYTAISRRLELPRNIVKDAVVAVCEMLFSQIKDDEERQLFAMVEPLIQGWFALKFQSTSDSTDRLLSHVPRLMNLRAIESSVRDSDDLILKRARDAWVELWRAIIEIRPCWFKQHSSNTRISREVDYGIGFGRIVFSFLVRLFAGGRDEEISQSLAAVRELRPSAKFEASFSELISNLSKLATQVSLIWGAEGFEGLLAALDEVE